MNKKIKNITSLKNVGEVITLQRQSNSKYLLVKDLNLIYYLVRLKDNKVVEVGDKEEAEDLILYTVNECASEVKQLFNN